MSLHTHQVNNAILGERKEMRFPWYFQLDDMEKAWLHWSWAKEHKDWQWDQRQDDYNTILLTPVEKCLTDGPLRG
jgi:hypothetical protein